MSTQIERGHRFTLPLSVFAKIIVCCQFRRLICGLRYLIFPILFFGVIYPAHAADLPIKILINSFDHKNHTNYTGAIIEAEDLDIFDQMTRDLLQKHQGKKVFNFHIEDGYILLNGLRLLSRQLRLTSRTNRLYLGARKLSGDILLAIKSDTGQNQLEIVNQFSMETYLQGVLAQEIPLSWPLEALKAQAVVSRSYALFQRIARIDESFHLKSSIYDQVYKGLDAAEKNQKLKQAVQETRGLVLTFKNLPVKAYFHSCCGGHTESGRELWNSGDTHNYLFPAVPCPSDRGCPHYGWRYRLSQKQLQKLIGRKTGINLKKEIKIAAIKRSSSGRIRQITFRGAKGNKIGFTGYKFRRLAGIFNLKSLRFKVEKSGDDFLFNGDGFGHGVGLCQWGAKGMALKGHNWQQILSHYYPGVELRTIY